MLCDTICILSLIDPVSVSDRYSFYSWCFCDRIEMFDVVRICIEIVSVTSDSVCVN